MFQFRRFPSYAYFVQRRMTGYCPAGLPHSDIPGSMDICSSPRLFAACHVLLRLLMPRHSPCALISLTLLVLRIMQASDSVHCSFVLPFFSKSPQITLLPLCCLLAIHNCFAVQFSRCRSSNLFQGQIEMLGRLPKHFNLILWWR